jgi:hypothetical protein
VRDLPVHGVLGLLRGGELQVLTDDTYQLLDLGVWRCRAVLGHEHDAVMLTRHERSEAVRLEVEAGKAVLVRHTA